MTKAEAVLYFKENILPDIKKQEGKRVDEPMRSQAWNDYTDGLCKDRRITLKQYESWTNPF